ncbi:MAG: amidohydrolase family protein [Bacteroidetes bacterium]|nr:amidohydrolase family protein [Bacteroidota bacterium]
MRKITADKVFLYDGQLHQDTTVITDKDGLILDVVSTKDVDPAGLEEHKGILVPGFVNTHCHLELSHMKGKVDTGTGLMTFIDSVIKSRGAGADEIQQAISDGEQEMLNDGIVAVGDISNQTDTFKVKAEGRLRYYTFVECFDLMQESQAEQTFLHYKDVYDVLELNGGSQRSYVPHAPYSMSDRLYELIREANPDNCTVSIHNQETPPENEFFESKTGGLIHFFETLGLSVAHFQPTGRTSIHSALPNLNPVNRNLFVHNTLTTKEDILEAHRFSDNTYWATCPNANLYIENRLPDYRNFLDTGAMVTIGTDSLTSNWQLSILEEMKAISRFQSYVPLETLLTWATINGAKALGFDENLGSIQKGKQPGLVLIDGVETGKLTDRSSSARIV